VIPGRKSMDFIYDADTWVPEASDKLTTDLLFLDRDNGRFGFGTTFPRATVDVRGDMIVSGFAKIGRDLDVVGNVTVSGNIECGKSGVDSFVNIQTTSLKCPYKISYLDNGLRKTEDLFSTGMIIMWTGNVLEIPYGWALCDGSTVSGFTTPDLRGRFILGYSDFVGNVPNGPAGGPFNPDGEQYYVNIFPIGQVSGESTHKLTVMEMPPHNHQLPYRNQLSGGTGIANNNYNSSEFTPRESQDFTDFTGENQYHNNMPPYYVLAFIIKL
jgi:microcystin-dependent protein